MRSCGDSLKLASLALCVLALPALALDVVSAISPRNGERPRRQRTDLIILHTTEAPTRSSINSIRAYGEAHYVVDPGGNVHRIIDRDRVAYHAGRSMWSRQTDIDTVSVGIEVVGYHNRDITSFQYAAIRELIEYLQGKYNVPDERVLTHSMVAYGAPNRWHKQSHRGRKRCGMIFAKKEVRKKLGLDASPVFDPDVQAGRLVNADIYLARVLYGTASEQEQALSNFVGQFANVISSRRSAWDIAGDAYDDDETIYVLPGGQSIPGNRVRDWKSVPAGTKVLVSDCAHANATEGVRELGVDGMTPSEVAGVEYNSEGTVYFLPNGDVQFGNSIRDWALPAGTRVLVGYLHAGTVTPLRNIYAICGKRWNDASTIYRMTDGTFKNGDEIDQRKVATGTMIFRRG